MYHYDEKFYDYINRGAKRSAAAILPLILQNHRVKSVADFGCGQGAWLSVWKELGINEILGLDGDYVAQESLLISPTEFLPSDLSQPVNLGRRFDLVQSLEVAEHLPETAADIFVDNLVKHGDMIFFSAATVGQGGENHINEQPYDYWRSKFNARGYVLLDAIRPMVTKRRDVEPWYRYNTFLFVKTSHLNAIPPQLARYELPSDQAVKDVSPPLYKARKLVLRLTPTRVRTWLAILKKHFVAHSLGDPHTR